VHKIVSEPLTLTCHSNVELVKLAGSPARVSSVHSNYHIPISNTAAGLLVLENRCASSPSNIGGVD
jgi:protocatechuate 4,5-dioxygenase, beta chain